MKLTRSLIDTCCRSSGCKYGFPQISCLRDAYRSHTHLQSGQPFHMHPGSNYNSGYLQPSYIGPKSRTKRSRKTKIGTEVAHVTRTWLGHHFQGQKVKRSNVI